jgi:hypothetical protein
MHRHGHRRLRSLLIYPPTNARTAPKKEQGATSMGVLRLAAGRKAAEARQSIARIDSFL